MVWKDIPGLDGLYQASSDGEIRSLDRRQYNPLTKGFSVHKGKVIKQGISKDGYRLVWCKKTLQAHRLVCAAFHGVAPFEGAEVCHANDIRDDNRAENLSWGTRQSNAAEMAERDRVKGEKHPRAKLTAFQVFMLREIPSYRGINNDLAAAFNVSRGTIITMRSGQNWAWL